MSKFSVQTVVDLGREGVGVPTRDGELEDRLVRGGRSLLGFVQVFVQDVRARFTDGEGSSNRMRFEDRYSAAALIGLFAHKHG
jgi:hypothetical protein